MQGEWNGALKAFLSERCTVAPGYEVPVATLWGAWSSWCAKTGRFAGTTQTLGRQIRATLPDICVVQRSTALGRIRTYDGLGLTLSE